MVGELSGVAWALSFTEQSSNYVVYNVFLILSCSVAYRQ